MGAPAPWRPIRVGYRGHFQVGADSLDVIELVMEAEDLPQEVHGIDRTVQYRRARIGERDLLLPDRAVLLVTDLNGDKTRTETRFNNCRQYTAESVIQFDFEPPSIAMKPSSGASVRLPDDFIVEIALETEIDSDHAAVGDPVVAKLRRDAGKPLKVPIGNESLLHGRINRLEVLDGQRRLDMVFDYLELNGAKIYIQSRRNQMVSRSKAGWVLDPIRGSGRRIQLQCGHTLLFRSTAMYGR